MPMSFETDGVTVAVALQRGELSNPIDSACAHRSPFITFIRFDNVFAVAVADALFRKESVSIGVGRLSAHGGIAWVPIQHEVG